MLFSSSRPIRTHFIDLFLESLYREAFPDTNSNSQVFLNSEVDGKNLECTKLYDVE